MSILSRFPAIPAIPTPSSQGVDNTSRTLDNEFQAPAYAASIALRPTKSNTIVQIGLLTGALSLTAGVGSATTAPFVGDKLKVLFTSTAGATVTFSTGFLVTAATLIIPAAKTANVTFMFNGAAWVEESRSITV